MKIDEQDWDVIVVGTGFGGSMTALQLARRGLSVLLLDRGRWVDRDDSAWDTRAILIDQKYRGAAPYEAPQFGGRALMHTNDTVGGSSVFYGAASFRLRELDFRRRSAFEDKAPLAPGYVDWPISYADLAPYYDQAEELLGVVGVAGTDPNGPPRESEYGGAPPPFGSPARRVADAAERLGMHPFPIPLAINFNGANGRETCIRCTTCDLYPCKIGAKNDLAVTILPEAMKHGAVVKGETTVSKLLMTGQRVTGVECLDGESGAPMQIRARAVVVSTGAIPSARLLLASGLAEHGPNGKLIGRYLMRHCTGISLGIFPFKTNPEQQFHKQVGITDFYWGNPAGKGPVGSWGMIQGLQVPPPEYLETAPFPFGVLGKMVQPNAIFLICIAEDIPQYDNRVLLHPTKRDAAGQPLADVYHKYLKRDYAGRTALLKQAGRILRKAGALVAARKPIYSFSHGVGTCRFGLDPEHAVLDPMCNYFGVPNLFVVDGSFLPTAGGVNPSLTIAANALRVGEHMAENWTAIA